MRKFTPFCPQKKSFCRLILIVFLVQILVIFSLIQSNIESSSGEVAVFSATTHQFVSYSIPTNLSPQVHFIDLNVTSNNTEYECKPAKLLFNEIDTIDCFEKVEQHNLDVEINSTENLIDDEENVKRLFRFLIGQPELNLIDIGTDTSSSIMYAATLARFVLAIDHDRSNLFRLRHTIQKTKMIDRVVLIHNVIRRESGQFYEMSSKSPEHSSRTKHDETKSKLTLIKQIQTINQSNVVQTIRFDDLLPIITSIGLRNAVIKINLDRNENQILDSGESIFNKILIPLIQMRWSPAKVHRNYVRLLIQNFNRRNYLPMTADCQPLNLMIYRKWPKTVYWLNGNSSNFC